MEESPVSAAPKPVVRPAAASIAPPSELEVRNTLARIYGKTLSVNKQRQSWFFAGDFNSDGSEDLAVIVLPNSGKLKELNSEVANWILDDPQTVILPDPTKSAQVLSAKPQKVRVAAGETLLAVIHGHQAEGWRNPDARQTYLLKHAVGSGMRVTPVEEAREEVRKENKPWILSPQAQGEVLEEELEGRAGFLYWTGAQYAFHASPHKH